MRRRLLRQWRSVSFTARFSVVLLVMGALVTAVPLLIVFQQGRAVAVSHVTDQAQLLAQLVSDQDTPVKAYASNIASQLDGRGQTDPASLRAALLSDSRAATPGDVIAVLGVQTTVFRNGAQVAAGDAVTLALVGAHRSNAALIEGPAHDVWVVGYATSTVAGGTVVTARLLPGNLVPEMVLVLDGHVAETGQLGDAPALAGSTLDPAVADLITAPGTNAVVTIRGRETAVASVDLGNGFVGLISSPTGGLTSIDGTTLVLVALSLIALLMTVIVVQADLHQPLRRLERAAAALAEDDVEVAIPDNLGTDVVGRLAQTLEITRRRLRATLRASRARAAVASELNTPQPLRGALHSVVAILREATDAANAVIVVSESELGDGFVVSSDGSPLAVDELLGEESPLAAAIASPGVHAGSLLLGSATASATDAVAASIRMGGTTRGAVAILGPDVTGLRDNADTLEAAAEQIALALERYRILSIVERQASIDDLTGLHNHRFLVDYLGQQVAVAERQATDLTVLMLDIDHFKKLNDGYGHHAGDAALQAFATAMTTTVRRSDLAARYGGEEFVVVMSNTTAAEGLPVAEKIRMAVEALDVEVAPGVNIAFTVSIGLASYPQNTVSGRDLVRLADEALYVAKSQGRNRVVAHANVTVQGVPPGQRRGKKKEPSPEGEGSHQT